MTVGAPQPDDAFIQILARFQQSEQDRLNLATSQLHGAVIPRLQQYGIANIEAAYSGYGDSGAIDGVQYRDAAGQRVDRTSLPTEIIEQLENCIYEFLPSGFEINDGGQGTVLIDTRSAKITLRHQENYTETHNSIREFTL
jgi:hypothetical protein